MLLRFQGADGKRLLVEAIARQKMLSGNNDVAELISSKIELIAVSKGQSIIQHGGADNDLYFILSGNFSIVIKGRQVAVRTIGDHVGEMALLDPMSRRSATVLALEDSVVGKISEANFSSIADRYPKLWREIAIEVSNRLRQRSVYIKEPNPVPIVFIGSSREALPIAEQIKEGIESPSLIVRLWTDGVFNASSFTLEDLETQIGSADFAILVASPDDKVFSRSSENDAPRDNIVFELGLFMGAIGRKRSYMVVPRGKDIKIPSDLLGMMPLQYDASAISAICSSSLCRDFVSIVNRMGSK